MGLGQIQPKSAHGLIFQNKIRNRFRRILKMINGRWPRKTIEIMEGGGLILNHILPHLEHSHHQILLGT